MTGYEPYLMLVLVGFLPTEVWRVLAVFAARRLDEDSEALVLVRAIATALLAGVVAKLLLSPAGALAHVPLLGRLGAVAVGAGVHFAAKRSVAAAVIASEIVIVASGQWYG